MMQKLYKSKKIRFILNVFSSEIMGDVVALFDRTTVPGIPIRRLGITCNNIVAEGCEGYSLFTNFEKIEKERKLEHTVLELKDKFGKNSMLRAIDLEDGATAIERNKLVGGHNE